MQVKLKLTFTDTLYSMQIHPHVTILLLFKFYDICRTEIIGQSRGLDFADWKCQESIFTMQAEGMKISENKILKVL